MDRLSDFVDQYIYEAILILFVLLSEGGVDSQADLLVGREGENINPLMEILNPFAILILIIGIVIAGIRLIWMRQLDPMMDLLKSLLVIVIVTFAGIPIILGVSNFANQSVASFYGETHVEIENPGGPSKQHAYFYAGIFERGMDGGSGESEGDSDEGGDEGGELDNSRDRGERDGVVSFDELGDEGKTLIKGSIGTAVIFSAMAQVVVISLSQILFFVLIGLLPIAAATAVFPQASMLPKVVVPVGDRREYPACV